jgi:hypothetical protein
MHDGGEWAGRCGARGWGSGEASHGEDRGGRVGPTGMRGHEMAEGRSGSRVWWYRDRERLRWSREWRVKGSVIGRATQCSLCSSLFGVRGPSEQQHRLAVAHVMEPQCRSSIVRDQEMEGEMWQLHRDIHPYTATHTCYDFLAILGCLRAST